MRNKNSQDYLGGGSGGWSSSGLAVADIQTKIYSAQQAF